MCVRLATHMCAPLASHNGAARPTSGRPTGRRRRGQVRRWRPALKGSQTGKQTNEPPPRRAPGRYVLYKYCLLLVTRAPEQQQQRRRQLRHDHRQGRRRRCACAQPAYRALLVCCRAGRANEPARACRLPLARRPAARCAPAAAPSGGARGRRRKWLARRATVAA